MLFLELIAGILIVLAFIHFFWTKKQDEYKGRLIMQHLHTSQDMKKTLALGLYLRFLPTGKKLENHSLLLKDDITLEAFTASLLEKTRGGTAWVLADADRLGINLEHQTKEGLFLGQIVRTEHEIGFEQIALVHSNVVKKRAAGGYVVTAGIFSEDAIVYAKGLNIELIDGVGLTDLWLASLGIAEKEMQKILPQLT
ncbi:restriction endonuclease [Bacillales bacterium AN1005]|uniref:restriction endonuclease n=1 Tax=Niallia taxi TaxID=2499688 RepID=UPI0011A183D2|nr:restriction endonuclease [Niallia taxi]MCT2344781.1 restriction endonuclease [Niallia taxi]